ncbi:MAG: hypothetical protein GWN00_38960 [Aliifodinibius sp.]|nr:hypothetical protein [Fodinibius sp.]NIY30546.1 hypothetical protein [Fodinibius sp.]
MISISESVLGGLVIALVSAFLGKFFGEHGKVSDKVCERKRASCTALFDEKLDHILKEVKELKKIVNGKLLGL